MNRMRVVLASLLLVGLVVLVGCTDALTGPRLSLCTLYLVPVLVAVARLGRPSVVLVGSLRALVVPGRRAHGDPARGLRVIERQVAACIWSMRRSCV
jgi:hypothetical protein